MTLSEVRDLDSSWAMTLTSKLENRCFMMLLCEESLVVGAGHDDDEGRAVARVRVGSVTSRHRIASHRITSHHHEMFSLVTNMFSLVTNSSKAKVGQ